MNPALLLRHVLLLLLEKYYNTLQTQLTGMESMSNTGSGPLRALVVDT